MRATKRRSDEATKGKKNPGCTSGAEYGELITIDRTSLSDTVVRLFCDAYRTSVDDLLCDPWEAMKFADHVRGVFYERLLMAGHAAPRLQIVVEGIPVPLLDRYILKALINSRKRSSLRRSVASSLRRSLH